MILFGIVFWQICSNTSNGSGPSTSDELHVLNQILFYLFIYSAELFQYIEWVRPVIERRITCTQPILFYLFYWQICSNTSNGSSPSSSDALHVLNQFLLYFFIYSADLFQYIEWVKPVIERRFTCTQPNLLILYHVFVKCVYLIN